MDFILKKEICDKDCLYKYERDIAHYTQCIETYHSFEKILF